MNYELLIGLGSAPVAKRQIDQAARTSTMNDEARESVLRTLRFIRHPLTLQELSSASQVGLLAVKRLLLNMQENGSAVRIEGNKVIVDGPLG